MVMIPKTWAALSDAVALAADAAAGQIVERAQEDRVLRRPPSDPAFRTFVIEAIEREVKQAIDERFTFKEIEE